MRFLALPCLCAEAESSLRAPLLVSVPRDLIGGVSLFWIDAFAGVNSRHKGVAPLWVAISSPSASEDGPGLNGDAGEGRGPAKESCRNGENAWVDVIGQWHSVVQWAHGGPSNVRVRGFLRVLSIQNHKVISLRLFSLPLL